MNKTLVTLFIVLTIGLLIGIVVLDGAKAKTAPVNVNTVLASSTPVLFYETTCPNCLVVEDFITQNKTDEKLPIQKIEVTGATNAKILIAVAQKCNIPTTSLGVPLLWAEGKCYEGRLDIINYISSKVGIVVPQTSQSTPSSGQ